MDRPSNRQLISSIAFIQKEEPPINTYEKLRLKENETADNISIIEIDLLSTEKKKQNSGPPTILSSSQIPDLSPIKENGFPSIEKYQNAKRGNPNFIIRNRPTSNEVTRNVHSTGNTINLLPTNPIQPLRTADLFAELAGTLPSEGSGHILVPIQQKHPSWIVIADFTLGVEGVNTHFSTVQNQSIFDNRQTLVV